MSWFDSRRAIATPLARDTLSEQSAIRSRARSRLGTEAAINRCTSIIAESDCASRPLFCTAKALARNASKACRSRPELGFILQTQLQGRLSIAIRGYT